MDMGVIVFLQEFMSVLGEHDGQLDGWVCMTEMLEIAEELLEKKVMDLIWGSLSVRHLATNIPAVRANDSPSYVLDLLPKPYEPHHIILSPFLITTPAPILFFPLHKPSVAITRTSLLLSASFVLCFTSSS